MDLLLLLTISHKHT